MISMRLRRLYRRLSYLTGTLRFFRPGPTGPKGRMPVILEPEDYETWLTGPIEKARALLRPFSPEKMRIIKHGFDEKQDLPQGPGGAFA